jgi:hypothetical protein
MQKKKKTCHKGNEYKIFSFHFLLHRPAKGWVAVAWASRAEQIGTAERRSHQKKKSSTQKIR